MIEESALEGLVNGSFQNPDNQERPQLRPARNNNKNALQAVIKFAFCGKAKACGHSCKGIQGENECLTCLTQGCQGSNKDNNDES